MRRGHAAGEARGSGAFFPRLARKLSTTPAVEKQTPDPLYRRALMGLVVAAVLGMWFSAGPIAPAQSQDPTGETLEDVDASTASPSTAAASNSDGDDEKSRSLFGMLFEGGALGIFIVLLILLLSTVSVAFIVEHSMTIRHNALMPDRVMAELEQFITNGQVDDAIEYCHLPENYSLVSSCVLAGLERFKTSEFGFAEYRSAVEEEGENQTGRLYRKTEVLGVIGAIAPMLGLTGTVLGMIVAFNTIAATEGTAKPEELAGGIGQALITTLLGLVVAIPSMIAFSFFRNRIDSIVAEAGKRIERIMAPLGRQKKA